MLLNSLTQSIQGHESEDSNHFSDVSTVLNEVEKADASLNSTVSSIATEMKEMSEKALGALKNSLSEQEKMV